MAYAAGEDRSSFQAVSSWSADAFGFAKATESTDWTDPAFRANWANLKSEGKVRGAYHFFHPADAPSSQASFFVSTVRAAGLEAGDILMCDAEIISGDDGAEDYGTGRATARSHVPLRNREPMSVTTGQLVLEFLDAVADLAGPGHPVILYTDLYMAQNYLAACSGHPLFIAYYDASPPLNVAPWTVWTFWQHEAGGGQGGGDADYFNGDGAQLLSWRDSYVGSNWTEALVANLPTLQQGSVDKGGETWYVHRMQALVAGVGTWNGLGKVTEIAADGNYGPATKAAVEAVQKHFRLSADGICGQDTWTALIG